MANRLIIGILVLLVVLTGGIGYYSLTLNRQVDNLSERLATYESEQTARVRAVSDNLAALRTATESGLSSLEMKAAGAQTDINAMKSDLATAKDRLNSAEENISGVSSQVTTLDKRVTGAETGLSRLSNSLIDAVTIYQKAVRATVRITNGQGTAGSGFIYDTGGRVVTAYHVVKGLSQIYIVMYDGRVSRANVIGFCPFSDIAVLKLDNNPSLDPLPLADSGLISVGESVIAIGSPGDINEEPLGWRDTLTSGIISQVNRYIDVEGLYIANLLQFDAAVNFGNSGGPLIDSQGKIVGVVNARIDPTRGDGICWAIASNKVKRVAEAIIAKGSFAYPLIGTNITDLTPQQVKDKSLETSNGVLVTSVASGGPAQIAGILTGDIIISMDGIPMRNIADLTSYLGEFKSPGDTTVIEVIRGTTRLKVSVIVGKRTQ
jgi:S1-C subfamily serine protease